MSFEAMNWCRKVTAGRSSDKSVLLALAVCHNADSGRCDPSVEFLESFTELNRKTVRASLNRLQINGFVDFDSGRRSRRNYTLQFETTGEGKRAGIRPDYQSNFGPLEKQQVSKTGPLSKQQPTKNGHLGKQQRSKIGHLGNDRPVSLESKNGTLSVQFWDTKDSKDINLIKPLSEVSDGGEGKPTDPVDEKSKSPNSDYLKAAIAMQEKIGAITKRKKKPNVDRWADDIRKLVELDGVDPQTIWRVFLWAHNDSFWRPNILSPGKLRDKFDTLYAKMLGDENAKQSRNNGRGSGVERSSEPGRLTPAQRIAQRRASLGG